MAKRKRKILIYIASAIAIYFLGNYALQEYRRTTYRNDQERSVTYILIDGLSASLFKQALIDNKLPFIQSLIPQSTYVEHGISSFPTMTGYAFYPFITGVDACESGIYGLRWFDKQRPIGQLRNYVGRTNVQMNNDIRKDVPTIFESVHPQSYTCSINTYMNRGVKESVKTGYAHTTAKYEGHLWVSPLKSLPLLGKYIASDHFQHEDKVTDIAIQQMKYNPSVQWITYPSPDAYNHVNGTTQTYTDLLHHLDNKIKVLFTAAISYGQTQRAFIILSDHGISDVSHNVDVCELLTPHGLNVERGKAAIVYTSQLTTKATELHHLDGYFVINGNLSAYLYMKHKGQWAGKMMAKDLRQYTTLKGKVVDLPQVLVEMDGVELVLYASDSNSVIIHNKNGQAMISKAKTSYAYTIQSGKDPLGYDQHPSTASIVGNRFIPDSIWRKATLNTQYPDAIYRIYHLVNKEKSGDIVLTSLKSYDFGKEYETVVKNYKGGHGGLRNEIISVPYTAYFPGKLPEKILTMRSEELGKKINEWLMAKK